MYLLYRAKTLVTRTLRYMNLHDVRIPYTRGELTEQQLPANPTALLTQWLEEATTEREPNAAALGTVNEDGFPSVRFVLIKEVHQKGLVFFTNYESRKGQHLAMNPVAALTFWWPSAERQVRVEGTVSKLPAAQSDAYFLSRPRESQIGAVASPQSTVIASRAVLEERANELAQPGTNLVRPGWWGGYIVAPTRYEFWQGRVGRLHDRFEALPVGAAWEWRRLAP